MSRRARTLALSALAGSLALGCASTDAATADPEAQRLDPPVVIVEEEPPGGPDDEALAEADQAQSPSSLAKDPDTEVITFVGADAPPAMTDEVTAAPKREPLPSMMSDIIHGPNK